MERTDWQRWRSDVPDAHGLVPPRAWTWTVGEELDSARVLAVYPVDDPVVALVEVPLVSLDRARAFLRAQTHDEDGTVDDHELAFVRSKEGAWTRVR